MLNTLVDFASVLLSGGESWLADGMIEAPPRNSSMQITPHEPSTLTLALIGVGTIAIYLMATGRLRTPRAIAPSDRSIDRRKRQGDLDRAVDRPSRGAA